MKKARPDPRLHALLDGEADAGACSPTERATLARYQAALVRLGRAPARAPASVTASIMAAVTVPPSESWMDRLATWLPGGRQWVVPALAGALAAMLLMAGLWYAHDNKGANQIRVRFEVHAPAARRVELVGDFTHWQPGRLALNGPDATGHWTTTIELPEGRYEYLFLVDGSLWLTDPNAPIRRSDGFGHENAVMDVCVEERS